MTLALKSTQPSCSEMQPSFQVSPQNEASARGGGCFVGWWSSCHAAWRTDNRVDDRYCTQTLSLQSDASSLSKSPLESFRQVAELQTCPLKLCLQKFLAAHELLSQTLHPHRCLHQTLMQTYILLLQRPVSGIEQCLVLSAAQSSI